MPGPHLVILLDQWYVTALYCTALYCTLLNHEDPAAKMVLSDIKVRNVLT